MARRIMAVRICDARRRLSVAEKRIIRAAVRHAVPRRKRARPGLWDGVRVEVLPTRSRRFRGRAVVGGGYWMAGCQPHMRLWLPVWITLADLAWLAIHEAAHVSGLEHKHMAAWQLQANTGTDAPIIRRIVQQAAPRTAHRTAAGSGYMEEPNA